MTKRKTKSLIVSGELNPNQEMFCQFYASGSSEYFGNAVWSYVLAYKIGIPIIDYSALNNVQRREYDTICAASARLLRNVKVKSRCNELLDALIKNEVVDRELIKVIMQMNDLGSKVAAIREYNKFAASLS